MRIIAGADGCKAGWLLVTTSGPDTAVSHAVCGTAAELLARTAPDGLLAIDIPIGLGDSGHRAADVAARAVLGARRSSIFFAPLRPTLHARTHAEANAISREVSGKGLSQQSFHIARKIAEVDAALRADQHAAARVHEVHPEVCFTVMNDGVPMAHPKKRAAGHTERRARIEAVFPGAFARIRDAERKVHVASDDILDALVALWSAARIRDGVARAFPAGEPPRDAFGLPMAIRA
jgi:predicted RNase H-like nuclease